MATTVEATSDQTATPPVTISEKLPENKKQVWLGFGLVIAAGVSYGLQGIMGKWAYSEGVNVPSLLTLRNMVAWFAILAIIGGQWLFRPSKVEPLRVPPRKLPGIIVLGILWVPNSLFFFMALELIPASTAALLVYIYPAMVVLWERIFFKVPLTRWRVVALGLAILGCAFTVDPFTAFAITASFSWLGVLYVMFAAFSSSWYAVLAGQFGRGISGLTLALYMIPVTTFLYSVYTFPSGSFRFDMSLSAWLLCAGIGVQSAFAMVAFLIGIKLIGATKTAITASAEPASSIFLAAFFLAEPLTATKLTGGALIILAIILLARKK